jgi:hypothetical protein
MDPSLSRVEDRGASRPVVRPEPDSREMAILPRHRQPTPETGASTMIEIEYIVKDSRGVERLRTADKKAG